MTLHDLYYTYRNRTVRGWNFHRATTDGLYLRFALVERGRSVAGTGIAGRVYITTHESPCKAARWFERLGRTELYKIECLHDTETGMYYVHNGPQRQPLSTVRFTKEGMTHTPIRNR